ncbi:hypothetical protein [Streptomyces lacrimifluminis]|nr:hypothetical protein [Streptomyces lacrimifluminis]
MTITSGTAACFQGAPVDPRTHMCRLRIVDRAYRGRRLRAASVV